MDSQTLRQRPNDHSTTAAPAYDDNDKIRQDKKLVMAKRGLKSLAVAVTLPVLLSILFSALSSPKSDSSSAWHPPGWVMHAGSAATASLMGLAAWLVWAEGGMRSPAAVSLYAAQLALGLAWPPAVMAAKACCLGLGLSVALLAALAGCAWCFRRVNPIAGDLVKPCIAWAAFLAFVSYRMM